MLEREWFAGQTFCKIFKVRWLMFKEKLWSKIKAWIYNCFQFMQTFSLASSNYMLVALSVDRWLIFLFKTTFTAIIAHWALINDLHPLPLLFYPILTEYLKLRHLAVTRPLSSSSTWMIPDICHFFTWDIFVAFWTPESFFSDKYQLLFLDPSGCCLDCCSPALPSLSSHFSGLAQSRCRRFGGRV